MSEALTDEEVERVAEWARIGIQDTCPPSHDPTPAHDLVERFVAAASRESRLRGALSWALDCLDLAMKRIETVDGELPELWPAGRDKARDTLANTAPEPEQVEPEWIDNT